MNTKEIINALRLAGHKVGARKRTDGGWLITSIDGKSYRGAEGNKRARNMLGVSISEKRVAQMRYNVSKFIRGKKKTKTLDDKIKSELRKVQRIWKKNKVQGSLNALNVKRHIREFGKKEALKYLSRMKKYGQGYAYDKNVEYLAQYLDDLAQSLDGETQAQLLALATRIRKKSEFFKEKWIKIIYDLFYEVRNMGYDAAVAKEAIRRTLELIED